MWTHRIMLEAAMYQDNTFLTLTYNDSSLPLLNTPSGEIADLIPKHLQDWLKRFRKAIRPSKIRYYAVGEYGDESQRPHFHAAIFNFPSCRSKTTQYRNGLLRCCPQCHLVSETWGQGNVFLGTLETSSAQYVAGYVTKKMSMRDDPRLHGRHPEFARMSLRPGIGADFMHEVASTMLEFNLDKREDDVPSSLAHGKRTLPLGRYLKKRLRKIIGRDENAPDSLLKEMETEVREMYAHTLTNKEADPSIKKALVKAGNQKVLQMETKAKIYKQKRTI